MLWFGSALEPSEGRVTRFISLGLVAVTNMLGVAAAPAMPLALLEQGQPCLITPVAGGCGPGWHRNAYGVCRPNVAPGVVVAPGAVVVAPGPCGGRGTHRVCNAYRCWRVCN